MITENTIRWGFIGCGAVTEVKSGPAYQKVKGFELAAVMRRDQVLAEDYAQRHGVAKVYSHAEDLINDSSIDAVYIATPPDTHKLYGLQVAKAGKPCCIEKPLAPNFNDGKEIVDAFDKAKQPLFVAYYRRSLPRFQHLKTLLDDGAVGKVRHLNWQLTRQVQQRDRDSTYHWRTDSKVAPGGYFDDLGCHGLDLFSYLLGDFEIVKGVSRNQQKLYSAKDAVSACWLHGSGATGSGVWNFASSERRDDVLIEGSEGELLFSVFEERPILLRNKAGEQSFDIAHPENVQLHHVEAMREALINGDKHVSTGTTALHTSWVMDAILAN